MVCSAIVDSLAWLNHNCNANIYLILAGRSKEKVETRFRNVLNHEEYHFVEFDATRMNRIDQKVDFIIHGASNANPAAYTQEPVETMLGNIIGLKCLLDLSHHYNSRLLYISSSEVYGNRINNDDRPYNEEDYGYIDILNARACYPNSKRAAETLCASYRHEYGIDFVITRLGHIYGPSIMETDTRASASFTRNVIDGNSIVMKSPGNQIRSYCYTLDCASAILTVLLNGEAGNAYNVSNNDSVVSIRDLAETMAKVGGVDIVFENPSDEERNSYNLMINSSLNSEKIERLGWRARFSLIEGIKRTLRDY